jgi:hypothetical protein
MAAGLYNFSIEQGTSFGLSIVYANTSGVPINLSAFSCARMQWNTSSDEVKVFTTNNINSGLYHFSFGSPLSSGIINFKVPASVTAGYSFLSAAYDIELETTSEFYAGGGPQVIRLLQGTVSILPEITRINCSGS